MNENLRRIEDVMEDCAGISREIRQTCDEVASIEDTQSARVGGLQ